MNRLLIAHYPNRETRVTLVRQQVSHRETQVRLDEKEANSDRDQTALSCHSLKTLNQNHNSVPEGDRGDSLPPGQGGLPKWRRFSTYARRQILRAGGALEDEHNYSECLFLTLTHPGGSPRSFETLARYSATAVRLLQAWLSKWLPSKLSIYTWEWQKRGALHLHMVVHCPVKAVGERIIEHLQAQWNRILTRLCELSGTDLYERENGTSWQTEKTVTRVDAQWCKKSVAAYLSKYVSKAKGEARGFSTNVFCPSRWYGVSRPLLALLRQKTWTHEINFMQSSYSWQTYEDITHRLESDSIKNYEYKHKVGVGKTYVAYCEKDTIESWLYAMKVTLNLSQDSSEKWISATRGCLHRGTYHFSRRGWLRTSLLQFWPSSSLPLGWESGKYESMGVIQLLTMLDAMTYSYRYTLERGFRPTRLQMAWYAQAISLLKEFSEAGITWNQE